MALALSLVTVGFMSCEKGDHIDKILTPPEAVRFNKEVTTGEFFIDPTAANGLSYTVPVSISTAASEDRVYQLTYSSATAQSGVQYTGPATVTIPAGQVTSSFTVTGIPAGYDTPGRKDFLKIQIASSDTVFRKGTFVLGMQKYCTVVLNSLSGDYNNSRETWGTSLWGPYKTTVSQITSTSATTAEIKVSNVFDAGWNPITFKVDWTTPTFKVEVVPQASGIADAGTLDAAGTYAGMQVQVRPFSGNPGTFSSCDNTITLRMQLGVAGLGWFANLYEVKMAR